MKGPFQALLPLVLASASPRRQQFFEELGVRFRVHLPLRAEAMHLPGEGAGAFAARAAREKAEDVAGREAHAVVIGADTVVALDGEIMGKPRSLAEALEMLKHLSGQTHVVHTACCVVFPGGEAQMRATATGVRMAAWDEAVLAAYAHTREGLDKAGAYAVQGIGAFLAAALDGSWSGVVGLPVAELVGLLLEKKAIAPCLPRQTRLKAGE